MFIKQLYYHRATVLICTICWLVFLLTSNRALVAGYTVSLLFLYLTCIRFHIGMFHLVYCLIILALVLAGLSLYIDPDSSKGRMLIYKISSLIWQDHFVSGVGPNKFQAIYNTYQASYFSSGLHNTQELLLADNTFYAFNDYFQFAIEYGVMGIIILMAYFLFLTKLIYYLIKYNNGEIQSVVFFTSQLIAISFAACFTHLFEHPVSWCVLLSAILMLVVIASNVRIYRLFAMPLLLSINIVVISICSWESTINKQAYKDWKEAEQLSELGSKSASIEFYTKAYKKLNQHYGFLLSYGNTLQELHRFDSSINIYKQASRLQMSHNLLGKIAACYQSLGNTAQAEAFYLKAILTVPNRFSTRYHLFNLYVETNQINKAAICGSTILDLPIKIPSNKVDEIRNNVYEKLRTIFLHEAKAILVHLKNT